MILLLALALLVSAAGCVSKAAADTRAREAFAAGQRQALMTMQQNPAGSLQVTVVGDVTNSTVTWTPDMSLTKAIVAAGYTGATDPSSIVIVRNGRGIQVEPDKLLNGEDVPLQPQDVIAIHR
jgi:hypothetical protein